MLRRAAWTVLAGNLAVILWGAFVRASGSGAGCGSHWPMCNGEVVPRDPSVATLIELTHRVTSGMAFIAVLVLVVATLRARPKGHPMRGMAVSSLVFMVLEAAIGAGLVLLELVGENQSLARAGWMAAHLVNTFLLVACLALTAFWSAPDAVRVRPQAQPTIAWILGVALVATVIVGVTGAVTALGDTLFPSESLREGLRDDLAPGAHFLVRLRVWHPVSAVAVGLYAIGAAAITSMLRPGAHVRRSASAVVLLVVAQIAGGFLNLLLLAPTWMQLVHLFMADALWIALLFLGAVALRPHDATTEEHAQREMVAAG